MPRLIEIGAALAAFGGVAIIGQDGFKNGGIRSGDVLAILSTQLVVRRSNATKGEMTLSRGFSGSGLVDYLAVLSCSSSPIAADR